MVRSQNQIAVRCRNVTELHRDLWFPSRTSHGQTSSVVVPFEPLFILALQMLKEAPDQDILIEAFLSLGRVDHVTMVMALHPAYLSCFLKTQHALLELDGPLPRHWRHYIAVMVRKPHNL